MHNIFFNRCNDSHGIVTAGPLVHRIPSFGYVIREHDRPGTLDAKLLLNKGLKPGPLFGKLKSGESITLENGETVSFNCVELTYWLCSTDNQTDQDNKKYGKL